MKFIIGFSKFDDAKTALSDILNLAATYSNNPDAFMNSVKTYSMPFTECRKAIQILANPI